MLTPSGSADSFRQPFGGYYWLGRDFIIPALIIAHVWINTGFAVMMIGAGLSSINRISWRRHARKGLMNGRFSVTLPYRP